VNQINKLRNKKVYAAVAVFLVLAILGGVFSLVRHSSTEKVAEDASMIATSNLPTLKPEDIGMVVTVSKDKRALMFELTKADDIKHVDYEIDYTKSLDGEDVPEGILGEMNIADDGITKTDFRDFGTCSSGVCHFDTVVSDIKILLKVTKKDGKVYQVEQTVKLK